MTLFFENTAVREAQGALGLSWFLALSPEVMFFLFCLKLIELTTYIWFYVDDCSIEVNTVNTENSLTITVTL